MKKIYFLFFLVLMSFLGKAQQLLHETFSYTADPTLGLQTQSAGTWIKVNSGDSILVDNGSLTYTGLAASVGNKVKFDGIGMDYYTQFTTQATGSVYSSFILNVSSLSNVTSTTGTYFYSFIDGASTSLFGGVVWIRKSATAGKYNIGISTRSSTSPISWLTNELDPGTSYFIVTAYDFITGTANDVARIWLNTSAIGGAEPTADATAAVPGTDLNNIGRIILRQDAATSTPFIELDEIRVGTTWASVTPGGTVAIPTPTTTSITPSSATAGGAGFTLTVNGSNFMNGQSSVTWNGTAIPTTFVSATQLTATVTAAQIATAGTATVGVTTTGAAAASNTQTFNITGAPSLTAGTLTAFGPVCINTTGGPSSFTLTGSNLTSADITVGPLAGYTFSNSANGPFTNTLTITHGASYSAPVYVSFTPTAVQSYNGNIVVNGGGIASAINVAATGSGSNPLPVVTTGAASAISSNSATAAGTLGTQGCSAVTAYGIVYSTVSGFTAGTQVASTNQSSGAFTSSLTGLQPSTTYYYKAYATNAAGTGYGTESSFTTTAAPVAILTATTLADFGAVCLNTTTTAVNSFTISGNNLTAANVTVGPLAGYTFSTTASGTYTSSLSLVQAGGTYSQTVFVRFTPTAVQSYNGNITVSGGGAPASATVAATGSGINTIATVATGIASAITQNSATAAGSISANGCSAVTAYGIEYSTINGFTQGTGTKVVSTNIASGNFTSSLTGLAPNTTYYFRAYATNAGGTAYGAQQSFITLAPPPVTLAASAISAPFGAICVNANSAPATFTITGANLTNAPVTVGPLAGYTFSTTQNGTYTPSLSITQAGGTFNQTVYVMLTPAAVQSYNGNIAVGGGGFTPVNNVAVTGSGVNGAPAVTTGVASDITSNSALLAGAVSSNGCSNVSSFGIEYSSISGFTSGTRVTASGNTGAFAVNVTNLVPGATYYFKAFATNAGGTAYGSEQSFTVASLPNGFTVYPVPVTRGSALHFSHNGLQPGYYGLVLYNSVGEQVLNKGYHIQVNFIKDELQVPASLPAGVYRLRLFSATNALETKSIIIR